jgi:prepilin-type N-terminal cleavage/methylation domain-containing protein
MGTKNHRFIFFSLKGFTLVELMIVISIIAILATIVIMAFHSQILKGNDARRRADINRIKIAVEEYEKDHNCYPLASKMQTCGTDPEIAIHPYLNNVPCDPVTRKAYIYEASCSGDNCCPAWYRIYADMEYTQDPSLTPGIGPDSAYNYVSGSDNAPTIVVGSHPTSPPRNIGQPPDGQHFYGCRSGSCVEIGWNFNIPGPECTPNFRNSTCSDSCGPGEPECKESN